MTRAQLEEAGHSRSAVTHWMKTGRLHRLHRGVFYVGYVSPSPYARLMAALLACGPGSAVSHLSAATLWEIVGRAPDRVEVTTTNKRSHPGLAVHRTCRLNDEDIATRHDIPVTSVARTLVDIAPMLDAHALARALNEARIRHGLRNTTLERILTGLPTRAGTAQLRALLKRHDAPTRSALEDRFLELVERYRLPRPEVNQRIAGHEVDMLWRQARLIVELDGERYHRTRFEQDRERDTQLIAAGYRVVRITWRRVVESPGREAARLARMLDPHENRERGAIRR